MAYRSSVQTCGVSRRFGTESHPTREGENASLITGYGANRRHWRATAPTSSSKPGRGVRATATDDDELQPTKRRKGRE